MQRTRFALLAIAAATLSLTSACSSSAPTEDMDGGVDVADAMTTDGPLPDAPEPDSLVFPPVVPHVCSSTVDPASVGSGTYATRINVGGAELVFPTKTYVADQAYGTGTTFGRIFEAEHANKVRAAGFLPFNGQESTLYPSLFNLAHIGPIEYKFDVPAGQYIVLLSLVESKTYGLDGASDGPGLQSISVALEGAPVETDYDVWTQASRDFAILMNYGVNVTDGVLDVSITGGDVLLGGIEVVSLNAAHLGTQQPPAGLEARGSFARNILFWDLTEDEGRYGYNIYRSESANGPYEQINEYRVTVRQFFDDRVYPGKQYFYRVTTLDLNCDESAESPTVSATPRAHQDSTLEVHELFLGPAEMTALKQNVVSKNYQTGTSRIDGVPYDSLIRHRGNISLISRKKGWKNKFQKQPSGQPTLVGIHNRFNYPSLLNDATFMRDFIAASIWSNARLMWSEIAFVHLVVNNEFQGVYQRRTHLWDPVFESFGRDPDGTLFKIGGQHAGWHLRPSYAAYGMQFEQKSNKSEGHQEWVDFAELISQTPQHQFFATMQTHLNMDAFVDYLAAETLLSDVDQTWHNYYWFRDRLTGKWEIIPWDNDAAWLVNGLPARIHTAYGNAGWWCVLRTRLLDTPEFRQLWIQRINDLTAAAFTLAATDAVIATRFAEIQDEIDVDYLKLGGLQTDFYSQQLDMLRTQLDDRRSQLPGLIAELTNHHTNKPLVINEIDVWGAQPFIEIYNPGSTPQNLSNIGLAADAYPKATSPWIFGSGTLAPGASIVVGLVGNTTAAIQSNIAAATQTASLGLYDCTNPASCTTIDLLYYDTVSPGKSYGRSPAGSENWAEQTPSP